MPVEDQFLKFSYPIPKEQGGTEIHMMWSDKPCYSVCWNDGFMWLDAYRSPKMECIVEQHQWMENDCYYADIVLPVDTQFEEEDIETSGREMTSTLYYQAPAIKHVGEAKSDYEIVLEIAKKLETYGGAYADAYNKMTGGKTVKDWITFAYENSGAKDLISWDKLVEKKYFISPINPDWAQTPMGAKAFYDDPVKNPLVTPTGKLEFYSQRLADNFPDDKERGPMPRYVTGGPGWTHDESLEGERCKKYPLLIVSNHPRWRCHAQNDDQTWLREIPTCKVKGPDGYMYEPLWIHPKDAAKRGIVDGDIVKIFNERGITLGGAMVTERIRPGAVYQDHGARLDIITDKINRGGDNNVLSPAVGHSKNCWGLASTGFLVECEKLSGNEYEEWRKKYPEAFAREYDPAAGLKFSAWIEGGV
jgi:trimethylamine-N-oxide reductase (cytochrome c)